MMGYSNSCRTPKRTSAFSMDGQMMSGLTMRCRCPEINQSEARFNLEAFSDSSWQWAYCKSTRKSISLGLVFLKCALILSICCTQASVALSSCEAELYAANGFMVECMFVQVPLQ